MILINRGPYKEIRTLRTRPSHNSFSGPPLLFFSSHKTPQSHIIHRHKENITPLGRPSHPTP
ncbi:hypothetical protein MTTB_p110 (plasmid) [Methanothermobacter tenebrarum]|uniref:Uncharacterized protein n=1 Tax=Methanothermobacter tenebrarum TaxID=680118 RepID=A0ABM7YFC3_9EURY|nr:hypothetical protein MTTB_p110 [Methanothermobacter tenebrarum]